MVVAISTFCYCEFVAVPKFSATGSIVVTNGGIVSGNDNINDEYVDETEEDGDDNLNNTDIQASINFSRIMTEILNKPNIFKLLSEELDGKYTYGRLKSMAKIDRADNSSIIIDISFTASTREEAIFLTNAYLEVAPKYIVENYTQANVHEIFVADSASKTYPRTLLLTAVGGIVGAALAYIVLFLIYCANTVIKGEDDFKDRFQIPVLGCIPDFATAKSEKYYKKYSYTKGGKKSNGKVVF